jgi:hypothetical protein
MHRRFVRVSGGESAATTQLCCSRSKFYELVAAGLIEIRHSFGSTLVSQESIDRYLDSLPPAKPRVAPWIAHAVRQRRRRKDTADVAVA